VVTAAIAERSTWCSADHDIADGHGRGRLIPGRRDRHDRDAASEDPRGVRSRDLVRSDADQLRAWWRASTPESCAST
jgi:hypothetical protein